MLILKQFFFYRSRSWSFFATTADCLFAYHYFHHFKFVPVLSIFYCDYCFTSSLVVFRCATRSLHSALCLCRTQTNNRLKTFGSHTHKKFCFYSRAAVKTGENFNLWYFDTVIPTPPATTTTPYVYQQGRIIWLICICIHRN